MQFAFLLQTTIPFALLLEPQPFLLAALLLLLARSILLKAILLTPLCLLLLLLALAVLLLAIASNLFGASLLRLLLPGPLIFGLGIAVGFGLLLALGLVLAPFLPFTLPPALRINRG